MTNMVLDLRRHLKKSLGDDAWVVAAYLFGSSVRTHGDKQSDLDLAFLVDKKAYNADPFQAASPAYMTATQIGMMFGRETDVTILNASSLEMAYEIVTTGQCVYEVDPDVRLEYEASLKGMYFDFRPFLTELRSKSLARL